MKKAMIILGIETSCDDTAAAVVKDGRTILSSIVSSQDRFHGKYGGVVPEIASRKHLETVNCVIEEAINSAGCCIEDIDVIAVTQGPGLVGSLLVGIMTAKSIAYVHDIPLIGVNHLEGHIFSNLLENDSLQPPFLSLIVSGGHSDLIYVNGYGNYEMMSRTRDDAVGEAYDKVAKYFNLGYPGGPIIDKLAESGDSDSIRFPKVKMKNKSLDFSFSGIKTAVINHNRNLNDSKGRPLQKKGKRAVPAKMSSKAMADILASFQKTVVEMLLENTLVAAEIKKAKTIVIGGGVAANSYLRKRFKESAVMKGLTVFYPERALCTDNAAMIACAGYYSKNKKRNVVLTLNAQANMLVV